MRVQIPAYTNRWIMGDRYGEIVKTSFKTYTGTGPNARRARYLTGKNHQPSVEVATVKLDKSNKVVKVILADCEVVS
jgi:DNA-binding GntR family transcriptional regulator